MKITYNEIFMKIYTETDYHTYGLRYARRRAAFWMLQINNYSFTKYEMFLLRYMLIQRLKNIMTLEKIRR